jgi:hypothetical protein
MHTGFWWGDVREKDHLEDLVVGGRTVINVIVKKWIG